MKKDQILTFVAAIAFSADVEALSSSKNRISNGISDRRDMLSTCVASFGLAAFAPHALAASSLDADKAKIVAGYKRLNYLLDHWEEETTVCKTGNDNPYLGCDRTPEKVMSYLGFKSMEDPLFRADKTLIRLQSLVPSKDDAVYQGWCSINL